MEQEICKIIPIELGDLMPRATAYLRGGWRLMQACSVALGDVFELSYSFVRTYECETLRIVISKDTHVPSISGIYECAFLYENEMAELFGVPIDMISTDYHGKLYRIDQATPFKERG